MATTSGTLSYLGPTGSDNSAHIIMESGINILNTHKSVLSAEFVAVNSKTLDMCCQAMSAKTFTHSHEYFSIFSWA